MAKIVLKDAYTLLNSVNLSDHVAQVSFEASADDQPTTAMGAVGVNRLPGLRDEKLVITFRQDFAVSSVDATLWPLYANGTQFPVEVRPTSGAVSTSNPKWTGNLYLLEYAPLSGEVGQTLDADVTFVVDGVMTRATA